jgi:DNA repair protein RecO (recombination protein O)
MVKGIGGKRSKNKSAFFQPLNLLDLVVYHRENKNLHHLKEVQPAYVYQHLHSDVVKRSLLLFVNELLYKTLHEEVANKHLFHWLNHALIWLDLTDQHITDFHLMVMIQLSQHLGFYPKKELARLYSVFDMQEGLFGNQLPVHPYYITGETVTHLTQLMEASFEHTVPLTFTTEQRRELLDALLTYYKLQMPNFTTFKSLDILKMVLG